MCVLYDMVYGEGRMEGREQEAVENAQMLFRNGADFELVASSITILSREKLEEIYQEVQG